MKTNTQSILTTTAQIVREILTALYNGLSRLGCGMAGLPYEN